MDDERVNQFVDMLERFLRTQTALVDAVAQLQAMFDSDLDKALIEKAAGVLQRRSEQIRRLSPTSLRRAGRTLWYPGPKDSDRFWPSLETYLKNKGWEDSVVKTIDTASSNVVGAMDFPGSPQFSTRGLVLGYVQSGKTANFTAVISKAADVGYKLFIVLSGLTNALRTQTQERLDKELVANHPESWFTWTNVESDIGDIPFNINALIDSDKKHLAVVKKNGPRLRRLLRMIRSADDLLINQCPVLLIDDECDQASVNASGVAERVTAINGLLRDIIIALPKVGYVGYTATPYANVLIDPAFPSDLYPRDFILSLPYPENYFGAEVLFGREMLDADEDTPESTGHDMIREVGFDEIEHLRPRSRSERFGFAIAITPSLRNALLYFVMATAAKHSRGLGEEHSSMLIHTTVYSEPHVNSKLVVESFFRELAKGISQNKADLVHEMNRLWNDESDKVESSEFGLSPIEFDTLSTYLVEVLNSIEVVVENSLSDNRVNYTEPGRKYVVIGGNVLARGLTIEGLISSLFLRTSSQYDSLMQMGRWFGYRRGYEDLPRIWMTAEMQSYFHDMATVEAELRSEIETFENENITPEQFAVRIRQHPDLAVTARNKMMASVETQVSFSNRHLQTRKFRHFDDAWLRRNWSAGGTLISSIENVGLSPKRLNQHIVYKGVGCELIKQFLTEYRIHDSHADMRGEKIIEYIETQNLRDNSVLDRWNVIVISGRKDSTSNDRLGPLGHVTTIVRSRLEGLLDCGSADIKALMSRSDICVDLLPSPDGAGAKWADLKKIREERKAPPLLILYPIDRLSEPSRKNSNRKALAAISDVLGAAVVFPKSRIDTPIGYVAANIDRSNFEEAEYEEELVADL